VRKWGKPARVYYDNGAVYRSDHMQRIVAELGLHRIIHTKSYRPMGHGKIEAFNRFVRAAFLAELRATPIQTLDALNEAFTAWADHEYNRRTHSETGQSPLDRWRAGVDRITYAEEETLRRAFLWSEARTPDKSGLFSLFGTRYQVGPTAARKRIDVRFDPEQLDEVEVWHQGRFVERVRPFQVHTHRRPKPTIEPETSGPKPAAKPVANWLGHLVQTRQRDGFVEPSPRSLSEEHATRRAHDDQALLDLLTLRLDPAVVDAATVHTWLERFGPFDPEAAAVVLDDLLAHEPADRHVTFYLDAIRRQTPGDQS
jgi:transposase InsO family protein